MSGWLGALRRALVRVRYWLVSVRVDEYEGRDGRPLGLEELGVWYRYELTDSGRSLNATRRDGTLSAGLVVHLLEVPYASVSPKLRR